MSNPSHTARANLENEGGDFKVADREAAPSAAKALADALTRAGVTFEECYGVIGQPNVTLTLSVAESFTLSTVVAVSSAIRRQP